MFYLSVKVVKILRERERGKKKLLMEVYLWIVMGKIL